MLDVLLMEIKRLKIEIICDCKVELIRKKGEFFNIKTSNGEYTAKKVVMSCGGKAFPTAGGTGLGLDVIKISVIKSRRYSLPSVLFRSKVIL